MKTSILLLQLLGPVERVKYYAIWTFSEVKHYFKRITFHTDFFFPGCEYPHWFRLYRHCKWQTSMGWRSQRQSLANRIPTKLQSPLRFMEYED